MSISIYAKQLRYNSTDTEQYLWYLLRGRRLQGYKFRRQYVIPPYIVDFICIKQKIIIELDGGQHNQAQAYDEERKAFLNFKGYRVMRFWNNEVWSHPEAVLDTIKTALTLTPTLSRCVAQTAKKISGRERGNTN